MTRALAKPLSRRTFLRGAGGAAVALPFLEAMLPRLATAATSPRRLVIYFSANGTVFENLYPGDGNLTKLPPILAPFEELKSKMLVMRGIDMSSALKGVGNGHVQGMACNLTATENKQWPSGEEYGNGISVDQLIAGKLGMQTRFPSLEVGVYGGTGDVRQHISYAGPNRPLPNEIDPKKLYERLFGNFTPAGAVPDKEQLLRRKRNQSVLDAINDDAKWLSARVSAQDNQILDQHLTALREIEARLVQDPGALGGGAGCSKPDAPAAIDTNDKQAIPKRGKLLLDITARGLACDLTRVVTFMCTTSGGKGLGFLDIQKDHHALSHAQAVPELTKLEVFYAQQLNDFAKQLDGITEGTGSVLDNSGVLWTHEIATGPTHPRTNCHYVMLGGGGGAFKTGRALSFNRERAHNDLFLSLIHMMGFADVNTFGNPAYVKGALPLG